MVWLDLKKPGYQMFRELTPEGRWYAIRVDPTAPGFDPVPLSKLAPLLRMVEFKEHVWASDREIDQADVRTLFPKFAAVRDRENPNSLSVSQRAALVSVRPIGTNTLGEPVSEQNGVRFVEDDLGARIRENDNPATGEPGRFLRAVDPVSLYKTAATLVLDIGEGATVTRNRLESALMQSALPGQEPRYSIREFQEAFESAQARFIAGLVASAPPGDPTLFSNAQALYQRQPTFTQRSSTQVELQQFSTPTPLAVAVQLSLRKHLNTAIDEGRPYKVYEPTVGHGALLSVLAGVAARDAGEPDGARFEFYANDLDANRLQRFGAALGSMSDAIKFNVTQFDAAMVGPPVNDLDLVITNPPFGNMAAYSEEINESVRQKFGRAIGRIDQAIALRAMEGLRPGGRAVMILAADSYLPHRRQIVEPISRRFFDYLEDNFHIDGAAEVEGRLYAKNGAAFPVRIVMVTKPDPANGITAKNVRIPDKLPGLSEWQHVMLFSRAVVSGLAVQRMAALNAQQVAQQESDQIAVREIEAARRENEGIVTETDDLRALMVDMVGGDTSASGFEMPPAQVAETADADIAALSAEIGAAEEAADNNWQTPYVPASRIGISRVVVPSYLKEPMEKALTRVGADYADGVDEYVSQKLSRTYEELGEQFLPHQIDGVALGAKAVETSGAIIVADQTGMGKGRLIAGIAESTGLTLPLNPDGSAPEQALNALMTGPQIQVNKGGTIILIADQASVFNEFVRDLSQSANDQNLSPLIVTPDRSTIYDPTGLPRFAYDQNKVQRAMKAGSFLGANLICVPQSFLIDYRSSEHADERLQWLIAGALDAEKNSGKMPSIVLAGEKNFDPNVKAHIKALRATEGSTGRFTVQSILNPSAKEGTSVAPRATARPTPNGEYRLTSDFLQKPVPATRRQIQSLANQAAPPVNKGGTIIFVTEKPHLFTDFMRDMIDIGAASKLSPLIVNAAKSTIYDQDGNVLFTFDPVRLQRAMDTGTFLGANLIALTYSQLAAGNADKRLQWLQSAMIHAERDAGQMPLIILDEAHNAAGDSATNARFLELLGTVGRTGAAPVVYSSATFAKRAENMSIYYRVLPSTFKSEDIDKAVSQHGESILELLTERMALQGSIVRREHDLSNLTFSIVKPRDELLPVIRAKIDAAAQVFEYMGYMAGDTDRVVGEISSEIQDSLKKLTSEERKGNRMGVAGTGFGSRLFTMSRQFYMSLKTPIVIESALNALKQGRRPVIGMQMTMEAAIRNAIADYSGETLGEDGEILPTNLSQIPIKNDFKIAMRLMAARLSQYKLTDRRGNVEVITLTGPEWEKSMKIIKDAIDAMPEGLPLSPIDTYQHALEDAGWRFGLISGMSIGFNKEGLLYVKPPVNVSKVVRDFRSGELDSAGLTSSGATGISLQPTRHTIDQRQIELFEWQCMLDINTRVQLQGRVNRTGQTSDPIISTVTTGLSGEIREASVQNNKMRSLSAATTSNRDNPALDTEVPDMVNRVGNKAACAFMRDNPAIIERLGMSEDLETIMQNPGEEEPVSMQPLKAISRLTGRLHMLTDEMQNGLYDALKDYYFQIYQRMCDEGNDPFRTPDLEWNDPKIEAAANYMPPTDTESPFGGPVMAYQVSHRVELEPISWATAQGLAAMSDINKEQIEESVAKVLRTEKPSLIAIIGRKAQDYKKDIRGYDNEDAAKADKAPLTEPEVDKIIELLLENSESKVGEMMRNKRDTIQKIADTVRALTPGQVISTLDPIDSAIRYGMILDASIPNAGLHLAGKWNYRVAFAGDAGPTALTLASLFSRDVEVVDQYDYRFRAARETFDSAPRGAFRENRVVLAGNLFAAMTQDVKGQLSYYIRPDSGERQRVLLLSRSMDMGALLKSAATLSTPKIASDYIKALFADSYRRIANGATNSSVPSLANLSSEPVFADSNRGAHGVSRDSNVIVLTATMNPYDSDAPFTYKLTVPGSKIGGGNVYLDPQIKDLLGDFNGTRVSMSASFREDKADAVIRRLYEIGLKFYVPGTFRPILDQAMGVTKDMVLSHASEGESSLMAGGVVEEALVDTAAVTKAGTQHKTRRLVAV